MVVAKSEIALVRGLAGRFMSRVLDLLTPPVCLLCGARVARPHGLCADCWSMLAFIEEPCCPSSGRPLAHEGAETEARAMPALAAEAAWDSLRAAVAFNEPARRLVHALKYNDRHEAARFMATCMGRAARRMLSDGAVVVPVPLHRKRLWRRRFNQSAELGRLMARRSEAGFAPLALVRRRATPPQVGLSAQERRRNVRGAFAVAEGRLGDVAGRSVVLVDDVLTTGATAAACCSALKKAGAARVDVVVFALAGEDAALHI